MKITEKQLQFLITILHDSIKVDHEGLFTFDLKIRTSLYESILNQQSNEIKDVE